MWFCGETSRAGLTVWRFCIFPTFLAVLVFQKPDFKPFIKTAPNCPLWPPLFLHQSLTWTSDAVVLENSSELIRHCLNTVTNYHLHWRMGHDAHPWDENSLSSNASHPTPRSSFHFQGWYSQLFASLCTVIFPMLQSIPKNVLLHANSTWGLSTLVTRLLNAPILLKKSCSSLTPYAAAAAQAMVPMLCGGIGIKDIGIGDALLSLLSSWAQLLWVWRRIILASTSKTRKNKQSESVWAAMEETESLHSGMRAIAGTGTLFIKVGGLEGSK